MKFKINSFEYIRIFGLLYIVDVALIFKQYYLIGTLLIVVTLILHWKIPYAVEVLPDELCINYLLRKSKIDRQRIKHLSYNCPSQEMNPTVKVDYSSSNGSTSTFHIPIKTRRDYEVIVQIMKGREKITDNDYLS